MLCIDATFTASLVVFEKPAKNITTSSNLVVAFRMGCWYRSRKAPAYDDHWILLAYRDCICSVGSRVSVLGLKISEQRVIEQCENFLTAQTAQILNNSPNNRDRKTWVTVETRLVAASGGWAETLENPNTVLAKNAEAAANKGDFRITHHETHLKRHLPKWFEKSLVVKILKKHWREICGFLLSKIIMTKHFDRVSWA